MSVEVLVSVMNQNMTELVRRMKLDSDAVIINQCDHDGYETMDFRGHRIRFCSFNVIVI